MDDNEKARLCALYAEELDGGKIVWEDGEFFASIRNDSDRNTMIIHHWFLCETIEDTIEIEDSLKNRKARIEHENAMLNAMVSTSGKLGESMLVVFSLDFVINNNHSEEGIVNAVVKRRNEFKFEYEDNDDN